MDLQVNMTVQFQLVSQYFYITALSIVIGKNKKTLRCRLFVLYYIFIIS